MQAVPRSADIVNAEPGVKAIGSEATSIIGDTGGGLSPRRLRKRQQSFIVLRITSRSQNPNNVSSSANLTSTSPAPRKARRTKNPALTIKSATAVHRAGPGPASVLTNIAAAVNILATAILRRSGNRIQSTLPQVESSGISLPNFEFGASGITGRVGHDKT